MKKKTAANPVVIKSLGKTTGNIDPVKLRAVIRELQATRVPTQKAGPIRIQDTASGSGQIRLTFGDHRPGGKAKAKADRARSAG
jgi:hypothetical protein